jgi:formamidopyrimidine-DNA glycosylase
VPELPEAERARAAVEARALGRVIVSVDDGDEYVCRPHAPGEIGAALLGRRFTAARRRGKAIWLETDDGAGPTLGLHLGMAGSLVTDEAPSPRGWDRFGVSFADGGRLALRDRRRLGRARLDPDLAGVGPDAAEVGRDAFRRRVGAGGAPLKARLMNQAVVSGLGNLLVDEVLWQSRLSPLRPAGSLATEELDRLRRAARAAVRRAIAGGGVHVGTIIPERRAGGRCPRCGADLVRATVGGRTTWWCPRDQVYEGARARSGASTVGPSIRVPAGSRSRSSSRSRARRGSISRG